MPKVLKTKDGHMFYCPGCKYYHMYDSRWEFNGNLDSPTFTPSLLINSTWKDRPTVCHIYITDGKIQYLGDCTHDLKGQTIDMEEEV